MSIGHMTKQELFLMMVWLPVVMILPLWVSQNLNQAAGVIAGVVALGLLFYGKMYCWSHTVYEDGLSNPKWDGDRDE